MGDGPVCGKVQPPATGFYQGAFVADNPSAASISAFNSMAGSPLDIVLKFIAFEDLSFPTAEALAVEEKGGVIFIKLEPWHWNAKKDKSYSLEKIADGKLDKMITAFAQQAKKYGKRVMISFGHEMNTDNYPWGGRPEAYIKAYRHVRELFDKAGACNVTWVWAPNATNKGVEDFRPYYPGDDVVDWVGIDGYNWTGTSPFKRVYRGLDFLKAYGKPIMIAETACAVDSGQCVTDFFDYITHEPSIKGYIWFNTDKRERGVLQTFALKTAEERKAYTDAVKKFEDLLKSVISIADKIPLMPKVVTAEAKAALAVGEFYEESIEDFFLDTEDTLDGLKAPKGKKAEWLRKCNKRRGEGHYCPVTDAEKEVSDIYIQMWFHQRNIGMPENEKTLYDIFNYPTLFGRQPLPMFDFWKAMFGMIFLHEDELAKTYLSKVGIKTEFVPDSPENQLKILEEIYTLYLSPAKKGYKKEGDPRLRAENLTERALLLWNLGRKAEAKKLEKEAMEVIAFIKDPRNEKAIRKHIYIRIPNEPENQKDIATEYKYYIAKAKIFEIKLKFMALEDEANSKTAMATLDQIYKLAQQASKELDGLELLESYQLGARSQIQKAFMLKDRGLPFTDEIRNAKLLLKKILVWERDYNRILSKMDPPGKPHPWMAQLAEYSRTWLAKIRVFESEDQKLRR